MKTKCLFLLVFFLSFIIKAQKVGVVLSGGGAAGSAHIGVLKSLEENQIPIDYIVGTSIGALVGAFYAAGYSPVEIEQLVNSEEFRNSASGIVEEKYLFYFLRNEDNASVLSLNFNIDSILGTNLPTNLISSIPIDYGLMELFSTANAVAKSDFDSLMVPYRALAANISQQKQSILKTGDLSKSVRASMTYPFYIAPISINDDLMFDGGLYNNFPIDVMCNEFYPDYIIASNVASEKIDPTEDNLISQLRSLLSKEANFEINCSKGIIINTDISDISTFDFYDINQALERGYQSTSLLIDSLKSQIERRVPIEEIIKKRKKFNSLKPQLTFDSVRFVGGYESQRNYFKKSLKLQKGDVNSVDLKASYYKLTSNPKIKSAYPTATYNSNRKSFDLKIDLKKEKSFQASFGGVIASKPFSTGFFQLDHNLIRNTELHTSVNLYFGNFYNSAQAKIRWDIPFDIPFYLETKFNANRTDYFNGLATFIDDINPPYIINSESYLSNRIGIPIFTNGKLMLGYNYLWQDYEYYQSNSFVRGDTSDRTDFEGGKSFITYDRNSLNRKQFATKGSKLLISVSGINGREKTQTGSTAAILANISEKRNWFEAHFMLDKYFFKKRQFHFGILLEGNASNLPLFQNYTASTLISPTFSPLPENQTLFQSQYRSRSYAGIGIKAIYSFQDLIDFRAELYIFKPYSELIKNSDGSAQYNKDAFNGTFFEDVNSIVSLNGKNAITTGDFIGTLTSVYHSKIGPIAASLNYYDNEETKFSFLVHFGYILFNKRGLEE